MFGRSLKNHVFVALTLLALIPLVSTAYQGYHCGRMVVMDLLRHHADSIAEARQAIVTQWVEERIRNFEILAQVPLPGAGLTNENGLDLDGVKKELTETLHRLRTLSGGYEHLAVYEDSWRLVAASGEGDHAETALATTDFQTGVGESVGVYFGPVHRHPSGDVGIHMGKVIHRADGLVAGYLVANLNLTTSLTPLLEDSSGLWSTGAVYITGADNQPILGAPGSRSGAAPVAPTAVETGTGGHGVIDPASRSPHSEEVIETSTPLPIGDLRLMVRFDTDEAMVAVRVLLYRAVGMVSAALLAVILVSMWISRLLGAPLANLAAVARKISGGQHGERMAPMRLREADEVREAFNQMLDELRDKELVIVRSAKLAIVGELTSRVVHEMRNPLSSIKMNLQAIRRSTGLDSYDLELAEIAEVQSQRLECMLDELLRYGRPVALNLERIPLGRVLDSALADVRGRAAERSVAIDMEMDEGMAARIVSVDSEQFTRAVANLLKNAIEASKQGDRVTLNVRPSESAVGELVLEVRDQGPGIRPEHLDLLFRPFFTTKSDGTGLGLANVQKIVELHGGRVHGSNLAQGGASFVVEFPCEPSSESRN